MAARMINLTVECFVEKDGKYLMLKRAPNKGILPNVWIAPGGHQEFGEGVVAAARREIREETGIEMKNIRLRVVGVARLMDPDREVCFHILTASYAGGAVLENPPDGELMWLEAETIATLENVLAELKAIVPLILGPNPAEEVMSVRVLYESGNELAQFEIENTA